MPDIGEEHVADDEVHVPPGGLGHHPVPLLAAGPGLDVAPLTVLHIAEIQLGQLRLNPPGLGSKCGKRVERLSDF